MTLASATPALPATDVPRSRDFFVETFGFEVIADDEGSFETSGIDELYERCNELGVVHPNGHIEATEWGTREFAVLDPDGNLVRFWELRA